MGAMLQPSQWGPWADVAGRWTLNKKSWCHPATLQAVSQKICKNPTSLLDSLILNKMQITLLFGGNSSERKCLPVIAMKTFI